MSASTESGFEKADKLEGRGEFLFAGNLVERGPEILAGHGLVTDYIPGRRPRFEDEIIKYLQLNFPQVRRLWFDRPVSESTKLVRMAGDWLGQNGIIFSQTEFYSVFSQTNIKAGQIEEGSFWLQDVGRPFFQNGAVITPQDRYRNGLIEIDSNGIEDVERGSFWRGTVQLAGEHPGSLILKVRDFLEQKRVESFYPLWKNRL